ncbi:hypothetical protein [Bradyrhizobium monzae]|uniref:hypothetical protein n=1 Tax=Bradyrhizobium sp. Oc8 TaxID=2876780 RepID=UPI001F29F535|nr:hypothetical protein [Bradyrhizobium sp. Oc8]
MLLFDVLLVLAMMFFVFLPISDRRTVRMRLCMLCVLASVFSVSVARSHLAPAQVADVVATR